MLTCGLIAVTGDGASTGGVSAQHVLTVIDGYVVDGVLPVTVGKGRARREAPTRLSASA